MEREPARKRGGQLTQRGIERRQIAKALGITVAAVQQRDKRGGPSPRQQRLDRIVLEHGELVAALKKVVCCLREDEGDAVAEAEALLERVKGGG